MMDGKDLDLFCHYTVDDPVALNDHLSDVAPSQFRDDSSQAGELTQTLSSFEGA